MEKQRARRPEEKEYRKQSIVEALKKLLQERFHPLPAVNEIAKTAGVTKGVIYHYFNTREEIFLTLFLQESEDLFTAQHTALATKPYDRNKVKHHLVDLLTGNDMFMFLGNIAPSIMEANVSPDFIRTFKKQSAVGIDGLAQAWVEVEPSLTLPLARKFLMRVYYLALALWQHNHPPQVVHEAFQNEKLWMLEGQFRNDLSESFDWLWLGMISQPQSE